MPTTENTPKADTGFSMPGMPTNFGFGGMVCVYLYACAPRHLCVSADHLRLTLALCCAGGETKKQDSVCAQQ
jgi:hypothetical protein